MFDETLRQVVHTLFLESPVSIWPWRRNGQKLRQAGQRIEILTALVYDLLMEVEALRAAQLEARAGKQGVESGYGRAYRDVAYLTHNSCGPSSGVEKLLALFYPPAAEQAKPPWREPRTWRECLMLRRIGFSEAEIESYKAEALEAEVFT